MMIQSTRFGQLEVDPSTVLNFPRGIPGFETSTQWKLLYEEDDSGKPLAGVVFHLQSLNDPDAALPLADPGIFGFNYEIVLSEGEISELKLENADDLVVLVVLSNKGAGEAGTSAKGVFANIAAPILINIKSRIGIQKIFTGNEGKVEFRPAP